MGEFFPETDDGFGLLSLCRQGEWDDLKPFRADRPPFLDMVPDHGVFLDSLAASIVTNSDEGYDVFACPYLHRRSGRKQGRAVARRHVHADIDGPLDLDRVQDFGGMAVASGSITADGKEHGHVYVRLSESVPPHAHRTLNYAFGQEVGREFHDTSKTTDENVLRPAGTLNWKTDEAHLVRWLIGPDDDDIRTWEPDELADRLGIDWPIPEPVETLDETTTPEGTHATQGNVQHRLDGLYLSVTDVPRGEGNRCLNWAAGKAGALCKIDPESPPDAEVRTALVDAYMSRPIPAGESIHSRQRGALATVKSGWTYGSQNPAEALERNSEGDDETFSEGGETMVISFDDNEAMAISFEDDDTILDDKPTSLDADRSAITSWMALPLDDIVEGLVNGTLERQVPTLGNLTTLLSDGEQSLFYAGRVNGVAGESGAGKSWTGIATCAQEIGEGHHSVYVDLEDDPVGIVARLLDMGAAASDVVQFFHYLSPSERLTVGGWQALEGLLDRVGPSIVVIDSTGEGLALEGANPNADEEVAKWFRKFPRAVASHESRPCVLVLDHVTKAAAGEGLWPIGSQRKRAAIDGAQYMQRLIKPFDKDTAGSAVLICAKDRHGFYRMGRKVAQLHVNPLGDADSMVMLMAVPDDATAADAGGSGAGFRPTYLMERVSRYLENHPGSADRTTRQIRTNVKGKDGSIVDAVEKLAEEGYASAESGPHNSTIYTFVKPFREATDPGAPVT